jgi:hypothetical protein
MQLVLSFLFLLFLAGLTGYFAKRRGRDPIGWLLLSLLIGVFALLVLFILPDKSKEAAELETDEDLILNGADGKDDEGVYVKSWFYLDENHAQKGPVTFDQLQDVWEEGKISAKSYVWCEGMPRWALINELPYLKEAVQEIESDHLLIKVK